MQNQTTKTDAHSVEPRQRTTAKNKFALAPTNCTRRATAETAMT